MTSAFLARFWDPGLETGDEKPQDIARAEVERLTHLRFVASTAALIPRRLGPDATQQELALDTRRCHRIEHVAIKSAESWQSRANGAAHDVAREAAQVVWERWWDEHHVYLVNRMRYVGTWSQTAAGNERWAKSAITWLDNELKWLSYAMRSD